MLVGNSCGLFTTLRETSERCSNSPESLTGFKQVDRVLCVSSRRFFTVLQQRVSRSESKLLLILFSVSRLLLNVYVRSIQCQSWAYLQLYINPWTFPFLLSLCLIWSTDMRMSHNKQEVWAPTGHQVCPEHQNTKACGLMGTTSESRRGFFSRQCAQVELLTPLTQLQKPQHTSCLRCLRSHNISMLYSSLDLNSKTCTHTVRNSCPISMATQLGSTSGALQKHLRATRI